MLILKQIQLKNFLSHKDTVLEFKPDHMVSIDGKSGSGKSSIVEALIWGIYGKGRSDSRSLIRRGTTKAEVIITLHNQTEDNDYIIERSITDKNKHILNLLTTTKDKETKPVKISGKRNIQEYLEREIIHSSYLLFINSIVYPQDNIENFVKQTALKRKDIILEIVNAVKYDEYQKQTKDALVKYKNVHDVLESRIADRQNSIKDDTITASKVDEYKKRDADLKQEIQQVKDELKKVNQKKQAVSETKILLNSKEIRLLDLNKDLGNLQLELESLNNKLIELSIIDTSKLEEECKLLNQKRTALQELDHQQVALTQWTSTYLQVISNMPADHDYEADISQINQQLIDVISEEIICPELKKVCPILNERQEKNKKHLEELLQDKTNEQIKYNNNKQYHQDAIDALGPKPEINIEELNRLKEEVHTLEESEKQMIGLKNKEEMIKKYGEDIGKLNTKQQHIQTEIEQLKNELKQKDEITVQESKLNQEILTYEDKLNILNTQQTSNNEFLTIATLAQKRIETSQQEITKFETELIKTKDYLESLELLRDAFGVNGIKAIIIDYVIPKLEDKINDILTKLSDFRVQLETQKSGLGEDVILEGLFINIFNGQGEMLDFDNYSGGEKLKIVVAISEALAEIQKIGFRILDELFIGLDEESIESFTNVMISLQERFSQLVCISHLRNIKDLFEEHILITKTNGISQVT